jgi:hypothetical protein
MIDRSIFFSAIIGTLTLGSSAAWAGGCCGAACYRHVVHPPVYGAVAEKVVLQPPQVFARTIPGEYASLRRRP